MASLLKTKNIRRLCLLALVALPLLELVISACSAVHLFETGYNNGQLTQFINEIFSNSFISRYGIELFKNGEVSYFGMPFLNSGLLALINAFNPSVAFSPLASWLYGVVAYEFQAVILFDIAYVALAVIRLPISVTDKLGDKLYD